MKYTAYLLLLVFSTLIFLIIVYTPGFGPAQNVKLGVSFSPTYTQSLGLDWKNTYLNMLSDLKIRYLRLPTYWKEIEPEQNKDDFSEVDFMLQQADKFGAKVILVVGLKQPRWPECQPPNWAYELELPQRREKTLEIIKKVVLKYATNSAIVAWQVENEPLFPFGTHCDAPDRNFLNKEVQLVRSLDKRPIIITDSGEFRPWVTPMRLSDIFGTTIYRESKNPLLGLIRYPIPVQFYSFKSNFIRSFFAPQNKKTIVAELQTEPWSSRSLSETPLDEQTKNFNLKDMQAAVEYAKNTGFDTIYLWGIEWWYWMANQGHPEYLNFAKQIFQSNK